MTVLYLNLNLNLCAVSFLRLRGSIISSCNVAEKSTAPLLKNGSLECHSSELGLDSLQKKKNRGAAAKPSKSRLLHGRESACLRLSTCQNRTKNPGKNTQGDPSAGDADQRTIAPKMIIY